MLVIKISRFARGSAAATALCGLLAASLSLPAAASAEAADGAAAEAASAAYAAGREEPRIGAVAYGGAAVAAAIAAGRQEPRIGAVAHGGAAVAAAIAAGRQEPRIGAVAPAFTLKGMDGGSYSLAKFRGKPVVLNFWASWCGPCREEAPLLTKLYQEHGSDLRIVAVNLTDVDSKKDAQQFAAAFGFKFPVLFDESGKAADSYRIRPIPTTFFIDAQGVIQDGVLGAMTWDELDKRAERLLGKAEG
ncbi:TlpA disulfide reductase family protein [Cohnella lubricantis]|uniref:TlpA family protein disulfide reductase n=1 Tax=Cohnella lubricantis TaxID=2163172 RepID=A0A841TGA7_9BACL|nr:TlpA disulfide reductase family protein [Cohnella lubricantis]MBB6678969.1 TlpA family protein disulfide reductase [Cohnella lubricantis]MBP2118811.1 thiol-disulfide isomerase/thioredoxin [Cohnella lubricantis]